MEKIQQYFPQIEEIVREYCINLENLQFSDTGDRLYTYAIAEHKKLCLNLLRSSSEEEIEQNTKVLVQYMIEQDIPYLFLYSELITVVRKLIGSLVDIEDCAHIAEINHFFEEHENRITALYLSKFLKQLAFKNELRLSHIALMPDKKLMIYFERHIQWVLDLILYIQGNTFDEHCPELDANHCAFGKWLNNATTSYLISLSHFKVLENLHRNLHDLAANVVGHCQSKEFRPGTLIHLMQKIEYYSLEIGNEIAFLNEIEESAKDPLTHLLTRRLFYKIMINKLEISKATGRGFSLMMCDLDHFKAVNDTYGHAAGDAVLKHFASILEQKLRKSDYLFRFGGEEFMILLPTTSKDEAHILGQELCNATAAEDAVFEGMPIRYTISIGVISILADNTTPMNNETIDGYVAQVDEKLYLAKERGRNRVE